MLVNLKDIVKFKEEKLFNGAVSIDWFLNDAKKQKAAADSFVFHGPKYHGVTQDDIGHSHGHKLQDTATFTKTIVSRLNGSEYQPFTLAIAGYGTGKSHLALTLATLLSQPDSESANHVISALQSSDPTIGAEIKAMIQEVHQPCLVIAINGMKDSNLITEVTSQIKRQLIAQKIDPKALDDLRPRFRNAITLIELSMSNNKIISDILDECGFENIAFVIEALNNQDEAVYEPVQKYFESLGMPISSIGGESIKDILDVVSKEYCGENKTFRHILFLFDEFGRYTEFATIKSQVAGSGVLQDLFEAIQAHDKIATFIGFIQFELNVYVQRVASEYKNDILRYITRYQSAKKLYLSTNLETLIANLLEKKKNLDIDTWFQNDKALENSKNTLKNINSWFPQSQNYRLWNDVGLFHNVISKGCWPLSPLSIWFLFFLAAAGKHLQARSALALLGDFFKRSENIKISPERSNILPPVGLWSEELKQELISSEEIGQQGSITHAYTSVYAKHSSQLTTDHQKILQSIVLLTKMGLKVLSMNEAMIAISEFSALPTSRFQNGIDELQNELNVIEWDDRFKQFDILGDAVPKTQFLAFLKKQVAKNYTEEAKSILFARKASEWSTLLRDIDCDFAEKNSITSKEWIFNSVVSNLDNLETNINLALRSCLSAINVDEARGKVIYCYVEQSKEKNTVIANTKKLIKNLFKINNINSIDVPLLIVLLHDEEGKLGQAFAELTVLEEISSDERAKFRHLIDAHQEKMKQVIQYQLESMIKQRVYISSKKEKFESKRIKNVCTEIFSSIYTQPLAFPFDGYSTSRGNAPKTCMDLTINLFKGNLDYDTILDKPIQDRNRAIKILKDTWGIFTKDGKVSYNPKHQVVQDICNKWDKMLKANDEQFFIGQTLKKICQPPYGANIASASLLLGVFVAPRSEKLAIARNGQQYAISEWLKNDAFNKRKVLDLSKLDDVELVSVGEASSEWEELLDKWEHVESFMAKCSFSSLASELKQRIPIPPLCQYKYTHLKSISEDALLEIRKMDSIKCDALKLMDKGDENKSVTKLSRAAYNLLTLKNNMQSRENMWEKEQIIDLDKHINRARQRIIQDFPTWLENQTLVSHSPEAVGNFKYKMIHKVGGNLKALELTEQFEELKKYTEKQTHNAEAIATANQAVNNIESWLTEHQDALKIIRVAQIRGLLDVGRDFIQQLKKISIINVAPLRIKLVKFLTTLNKAGKELSKRMENLWNMKLRSKEELEEIIAETNKLLIAYEGCEEDIEDLNIMNSILKSYKHYYSQLQDSSLTWAKFTALCKKLEKEAQKEFGDEESLPWAVDETFKNFVKIITEQRKAASLEWLEELEEEAKKLKEMNTAEANRLFDKATTPPPIIAKEHFPKITKIKKNIENHLEAQELDWLLEKFKNLPKSTQKKFLKMTTKIV